jgi:hypothetical protein
MARTAKIASETNPNLSIVNYFILNHHPDFHVLNGQKYSNLQVEFRKEF